jgi:carbon monoxide dehydrogenase subunit G
MKSNHSFRHHSFVAALAALTLVGCNSIGVRGTGTAYEVTHDISDISEVIVKGNGELQVQNGNRDQLIVLAQDEIHEHLAIREIGNRIIIEPKDGYHFKTAKNLRYLLITNNINLIDVSGAIEVTSNDYHTSNLYIDASGSTDVDMSIYADDITVDASGAFDGYLAGESETLTLDFSGASDLNAYDLEASTVDIDISGAGTAYVNATKSLNVSAAGASHVSYRGNPRVSQSSAGASSVNAAQ